MGDIAFISAHADDDTLTMGYGGTYYLRAGFNVHWLLMSRGEVTAASLRLDGSDICRSPDHPYRHDPAREGYALPTLDQIGLARWNEFKSATFTMSTIAPASSSVPTGTSFQYEGHLPTNWGCDGCGSSTAPVTETGIAAARAVIEEFVDSLPPNTHFRTHAHTDAHPDHAACGIALQRMKYDPAWSSRIGDGMGFVSRLYWNTPAGQPGSRMGLPCSWFPASTGYNGYDAICDHLRDKVQHCYNKWLPDGAWAVGAGHSVPSQFAANFGDGVTISNLWYPL